MLKQGREYAQEREAALAEAVKEVASELRLIEAGDLVAYLRTEQLGNVRSLVNASTEMYFKPGTLRFGLTGQAEVAWNSAPRWRRESRMSRAAPAPGSSGSSSPRAAASSQGRSSRRVKQSGVAREGFAPLRPAVSRADSPRPTSGGARRAQATSPERQRSSSHSRR